MTRLKAAGLLLLTFLIAGAVIIFDPLDPQNQSQAPAEQSVEFQAPGSSGGTENGFDGLK